MLAWCGWCWSVGDQMKNGGLRTATRGPGKLFSLQRWCRTCDDGHSAPNALLLCCECTVMRCVSCLSSKNLGPLKGGPLSLQGTAILTLKMSRCVFECLGRKPAIRPWRSACPKSRSNGKFTAPLRDRPARSSGSSKHPMRRQR